MPAIYFYHSFPRHNDHELALGILRSILKKGLLLTGELQSVPGSGKLEPVPLLQTRICFTAIEPSYLKKHAETFGEFSLEFEGEVLRAFGAQPAVYFAGTLPDVGLYNPAGDMLVRHLIEAHEVLRRLWELRSSSDKTLRDAANVVVNQIHPTSQPLETLYFAIQAVLHVVGNRLLHS